MTVKGGSNTVDFALWQYLGKSPCHPLMIPYQVIILYVWQSNCNDVNDFKILVVVIVAVFEKRNSGVFDAKRVKSVSHFKLHLWHLFVFWKNGEIQFSLFK